ncbi:hypothetical protein [Nitrosomonas communis]|uniref:Uncharacterized protein n=1 Tax=Nitrosomonas communis TaxID=44574 RepID=A0A1I4PX21_9PROT|nr:hypothetical protein [Nitrosomonas communis]SFM32372.1 hypothetical protein SAMN05421863_102351 [Nitrosomonas communis]
MEQTDLYKKDGGCEVRLKPARIALERLFFGGNGFFYEPYSFFPKVPEIRAVKSIS